MRFRRPIVLVLVACAAIAACHGDQTAPDPPALIDAASAPALDSEPALLDVPTYEQSGESVHPDIVAFPQAWHGRRYWMAMTPYPGSNPAFENPSLLVT